MDNPLEPALFQVSIPGLLDSTDELGIWQIPPVQSFAAHFTREPQQETSQWRVELPGDPEKARQLVERQSAAIAAAQTALPDAARRLQDFAIKNQAASPEAFSTGAGASFLPVPEQQLADWANVINGPSSFDLSANLPLDWKEVSQAAAGFFEKVRRSLQYAAVVETTSAGRRVGLTTVSWSGDFRTAWGLHPGPQAASGHAQALDLAVQTRTTWLNIAILVTRSAVQLGLLFPTNPLLAIPAAYKFIRQVLEQVQGLPSEPIHSSID